MARAQQAMLARDAESARAGAVVLMAGLSGVAALIHVQAAVDHYSEYKPYCVAFVAMAIAQSLWAVLIIRGPAPRLLAAGAAMSGGIVLLWAASRTVGVPIAPVPWTPEGVGAPDVMATASELAILGGAVSLLFGGRSRIARAAVARLAPVLLAVLSASVIYGLTGGHGHAS